MNIKDYAANPSFLSSKLVDDKPVPYVIEGAEEHKINGEPRLCLVLEKTIRLLRLKPEQVVVLARAFGDDTEQWKGKTINLSSTKGKGIEVTPDTE